MRSKHGYSTRYNRGDKPVLLAEVGKARRLATEVEKRAERNIKWSKRYQTPIAAMEEITIPSLEIVEFELKEIGIKDRHQKVTLAEQRRRRELVTS